jgi:hypothetical protein
MSQSEVVATAVDPQSRPVELTADRWRHIVDGHPELAPYLQQVMDAVSTPTHQRPGRWPDEVWFYLATKQPSQWLKAVVRYEAGRGRIITAFARRAFL